MNLKLRIKNKTTLLAIVTATVAFVYQILGILGIVPAISREAVIQGLGALINLLAILGILVDPTTAGVGDSTRAKGYKEPYKEKELPNNYWEELPSEIRGQFGEDENDG